jgi:pimeloyl-ACP methyl ester carboxylesterase
MGENNFPPFTKSQWLHLPGGIETHHLVIPRNEDNDGTQSRDADVSMVMLHGTGSAAALAWSSSSGRLANSYSIYAPDLPAFGRTQLPWESFCDASHKELEDLYADWLASYIDALGILKPVVVAHSIGGFFAMKFAKKHPTKVSKLILVDPAGMLPTLGSSGYYFGWLFKLGIPTRQLRGLGKVCSSIFNTIFDYKQASAKAYYWLQLNASPTAFGDRVVAKFITTNDSGLSMYWCRPALRDLLTAGVPFAFVYGETDNLMPPTQGRVVAEVAMRVRDEKDLFSDKNLVGIVPGAWHMPFHVEKGDPFVDKLLRAIEVARLPNPSKDLLKELESLEPSSFASSLSLRSTSSTIERLYAHLRTFASD